MNLMRLLTVAAMVLCCSVGSRAEETVEIPLSEIWALDMPGTWDVSTIKDKGFANRSQLFDGIRQDLVKKLPEREATRGFAVSGKGRRALAWARGDFPKQRRLSEESGFLTTEEEVSLVFFAHPSAYHVHLEHVERRGTEIDVRYRLVPHFTGESAIQLALIPLGFLPAGEYRVNIIQSPLEQKYLDAGFQPLSEEQTKRIISQPFSFVVVELPKPYSGPAEGAKVIPLEEVWAWNMPGTKSIHSELEVDAKNTTEKETLLAEIGQRLYKRLEAGEERKAEAGFIVAGTGMEAIRKAHAILVGEEKRQDVFEENQELFLVFFSYRSSWYVHLHDIAIEGNTIRVHYKFVPSYSPATTKHFALIPIGSLKTGQYQVTVERLPLEQIYIDAGWRPRPASSDRLVSASFSFSIKESTKQAGKHQAVSSQPAGENHED